MACSRAGSAARLLPGMWVQLRVGSVWDYACSQPASATAFASRAASSPRWSRSLASRPFSDQIAVAVERRDPVGHGEGQLALVEPGDDPPVRQGHVLQRLADAGLAGILLRADG